jgi:hypothetical protein
MPMRRTLMISLYAGLGALIAVEGLSDPVPDAVVLPMTGPQLPTHGTDAADPAALAATALARPAFDPTRRPPPVAVVSEAPAAPAPITPPSERLAGIITADSLHVALFSRDSASKPIALGGMLEAWRVAAIYPDRVTLRASDGSLLVKTLTSTTVPIEVSLLRDWKPGKFHHEE